MNGDKIWKYNILDLKNYRITLIRLMQPKIGILRWAYINMRPFL